MMTKRSVLALFVLSIDIDLNSKADQTFFGLQLLIFINDGVGEFLSLLEVQSNESICSVFLYMAGLAITATITTVVFDKDVWLRDVDSSPSPFPLSLLRRVLFSCLAPSPAD